jgi:DnaK suppressor protein
MTPDRQSYFKNLLLKFRHELISGGDQKADPIHHEAERPDQDSQPLAEMSQAISSSRNQSRAATLERIQIALSTLQLNPDDYGVCEHCDEDIPEGRLKLMPWATACVKCLSKQENPLRGATRKSLTDFVS